MKRKSNRWLTSHALLSLGACLSILWSVYFAMTTISTPYQIELREGTAQVMTGFLLAQSNPFILENQPLAMNNYGLGYNLAVWPFALLLGNTLFVHRLVTFIFILCASLTGFWVVYRSGNHMAFAASCAAFIMIGLIGRGGIGAFPSAMGAFLFLLTISIPFLYRFTPASLFTSILLSIAAFYTKAYFVLGVGIVVSYLFMFESKRKGIFHLLLFLSLLIASFFAIRSIFPLYFINTVIGNISNTIRSIPHMLSQLKLLGLYFSPMLLVSVWIVISEKGLFHRADGPLFLVRAWTQPLMGLRIDYFLYSFLCTLLAFILFLGPHTGSNLNYAYHLVLPVFFCWFFQKIGAQNKWTLVISGIVIINLFLWNWIVLPSHMLKQKDSAEWSKLHSYVQSASNILNSPAVTSMMIEAGMNPLDSGQTAYFYSVKPYPDNPMLGPLYATFRADGIQYIRSIDNSIQKQRFDLVFTIVEKGAFYHTKLLDDHYLPMDEIRVDMPQTGQQWTVVVWKPISK